MEGRNTPRQAQREMLQRLLEWAGAEPERARGATEQLMSHFKSFWAVMNAPPEEVAEIGQIDVMLAAYVQFFPQAAMRYLHLSCPDSTPLTDRASLHRLLWGFFCCQQEREGVCALCVDLEMRPLACGMLALGSRDQVEVAGETILAMAMGQHVSGVFLAHNHPNSAKGFSESDFLTTAQISHQLGPMGVALLDHFLVEENKLTSMRDALGDDYRLMWEIFSTQPWFLPETDLWQMPTDQPDFF